MSREAQISVRPARYDSDARAMVAVLQANLPYRPHDRFFRWLYRENPEGEALAWVASAPSDERIVGMAAAFPKRISCDGVEARGYLLGDFCIDPEYRSLGLALRLQRACLDGVSAANADFAFDFPSRGMMAVYSRLRIAVTQTIVRYVKPLRLDRQVSARIGVRALATGVAAAANACLALGDSIARPSARWTVGCEPAPWGTEFDASRNWSPPRAVSLSRTARYLNWRYGEHPAGRYEMLVARRAGRLGGYLVRHGNGAACVIDDLLAEDDSASDALLAAVVSRARTEGADIVSAPWLAADSGSRLLRQRGFRARESSPALLLPFERPGIGPTSATRYLSHGDWEL